MKEKRVWDYILSSDFAVAMENKVLDKESIIEIVDRLRKVIFPGYFEDIYDESREQIIKEHLSYIRNLLKTQISAAFSFAAGGNTLRAEEVTSAFMKMIPQIGDALAEDVQAAFDGDPAALNTDEIILAYPGVFAVTVYRIAHELYKLEVPILPRIMTEYAHSITGIDIHPSAQIGSRFFIDHGTGVVIGETTVIGKNVKIYQGVTLGARSTKDVMSLKQQKRHPTIGDNVTIYAGTTILGGDTVIEDGATIPGNAFILSSADAKAVTARKA